MVAHSWPMARALWGDCQALPNEVPTGCLSEGGTPGATRLIIRMRRVAHGLVTAGHKVGWLLRGCLLRGCLLRTCIASYCCFEMA